MAITVLDLALFRGAKLDDSGSISLGAIEDTGLPGMGGCVRCGASIAAYNAAPTTTGYLACAHGCAEGIGFASTEAANRALFPEEYAWQGIGAKCMPEEAEDDGEGIVPCACGCKVACECPNEDQACHEHDRPAGVTHCG